MNQQGQPDGYSLYEAIAGGYTNKISESRSGFHSRTLHQNNTLLHVAVQFGRKECVELILRRLLPNRTSLVVDVNIDGETALLIAARQGLHEIVKRLLDHVRPEAALRKLLGMRNKNKDTALHEAVRYGHLEVVKLLTEADPLVEYEANADGKTPLYIAAEEGLESVVEQIIKTYPVSDHSGPDGKTAMHAAVISRSSVIIQVLQKMSPVMTREVDNHGWTPLHYAAYMQRMSDIGYCILTADRSMGHFQDKNGMTPLHVAAAQGNDYMVFEITLQCRGCVEALDHRGRNFLHIAALRGKEAVFKYALKQVIASKEELNRPDNDGNTPLHLAAISKAYDIVELLGKDERVSNRFKNKENLTALNILNKHSPDVKFDINKLRRAARRALESANTTLVQVEKITREDLGEPLTKQNPNHKNDEKEPGKMDKKTMLELFQRISDSHLVVAALIATVTFAAGFAPPGGYVGDGQNEGMPILLRQTAFKAFAISNTISMLLSSLAVLIHFMMKLYVNHEDSDRIDSLMTRAFLSTLGAILAMMLAFVTGTFAVFTKSPELAIKTCVIGSSFYLMAFFLLRREIMSMLRKLCEETWSFSVLVIKSMLFMRSIQWRAFCRYHCFEFVGRVDNV